MAAVTPVLVFERRCRTGRGDGGAGEVEQMGALGIVELECAGKVVQNAVGGACEVPD
nr:hypothetical protein [Nocardia pseudovaccinii]